MEIEGNLDGFFCIETILNEGINDNSDEDIMQDSFYSEHITENDEFEEDFFNIDRLLEEESMAFFEEQFTENVFSEQDTTDFAFNENQMEGLHQELIPGRQQLTASKKREIVDELLVRFQNGSLPRGSLAHFARQFGVHKSTITRVFQEVKRQLEQGTVIDVRSKKIGKCGPKPTKYTDEFLQSVPLYLRTTERKYAKALKIAKTTLHYLKKRGILRTHTSTNKPRLTSDHKIARMKWVLSHIKPATTTSLPTFVDMKNVIHIDEKWFYLNPETRRFYLLPKEEDPYRCEQSRRFKTKAMFMGIIGKPLYDTQGNLIHDGKYGIVPFVYKHVAKKTSKNRPAGAIESKAIHNINREEIRKMLMTEVLPAIKSKWPQHLPRNVVIQWDNARPHQVPRMKSSWLQLLKGGST